MFYSLLTEGEIPGRNNNINFPFNPKYHIPLFLQGEKGGVNMLGTIRKVKYEVLQLQKDPA